MLLTSVVCTASLVSFLKTKPDSAEVSIILSEFATVFRQKKGLETSYKSCFILG